MPVEVTLTAPLLLSFLFVLTRVASALVFVPLPGSRNVPDTPKIVIALCTTIALYPSWPLLHELNMAEVVIALLREAAFGLTVGVIVSFITEGILIGAQIVSLQAGYSFASTIDPMTSADSTLFQTMLQLMSGMLFFAIGLHHEVIRVFVSSLERWPPGSFVVTEKMSDTVVHLGAAMFSTGLRLALPVVAFLFLADISLALLGRVNTHLQLLSLSFPLKTLAALAILAAVVAVIPLVFQRSTAEALQAIAGLAG